MFFPWLHSVSLALPEIPMPPAYPPSLPPYPECPSWIPLLCASKSSFWLPGSSTLKSPHLDYGFWTRLGFWWFIRMASQYDPATVSDPSLVPNKPGCLESSILVLFYGTPWFVGAAMKTILPFLRWRNSSSSNCSVMLRSVSLSNCPVPSPAVGTAPRGQSEWPMHTASKMEKTSLPSH